MFFLQTGLQTQCLALFRQSMLPIPFPAAHRKSLQLLRECIQACERCMMEPAATLDATDLARAVRLSVDCAAVCRLTGVYLTLGRAQVPGLLRLCAALAESCAEACSKLPGEVFNSAVAACKACQIECEGLQKEMLQRQP